MTTTQTVWRRLALLALLTASIAGCSSSDDNDNDSGDMESAAPAYRLQLLHFADMDGSTAALEYVSNFSRLINAFESDEALKDNTLVLSSGDNFIPGPRFFAAGVDNAGTRAALGVAGNGRGDIAFVNAFDTAASVVGNHDLDQGTEAFAGLIAADGDYPGTAFPYLSTNLDFSTDSSLSGLSAADGMPASDGAGRVAGSATVEIGGETIGLVGASTPALASITSTGGITVSPSGFTMDEAGYDALAAEIQPAIDTLVDAGIDKIVLMGVPHTIKSIVMYRNVRNRAPSSCTIRPKSKFARVQRLDIAVLPSDGGVLEPVIF